jgi:hypothetical protein
MNKIDWTRKLTSRKFWLSIASFVAMLLVALGQSETTATQITSLIMAGATVIGYVIGEGLADASNASNNTPEN